MPTGSRVGPRTERSTELSPAGHADRSDCADSWNLRWQSATGRERRRFIIRGVVQGVGFRPHVYALARSLDLSGGVWNDGRRRRRRGRGRPGRARRLRQAGRVPMLPRSRPSTDVSWTSTECQGGTEFAIRASESGPGRTFVSPDVTICEDCLDDLRDPDNRRYRHPFVTCTNCGPRFTITTGLPYDRPTTTMAGFPMCADCAARVRRPGRPPLPRPDDLLSRLRTGAVARRSRPGDRSRRGRPGRSAQAARRGRGRGGQGPRRLPPRLRRDQRDRGRDAAQAQAARRQAVRRDGGRPERRRALGRALRRPRRPADRAQPARSCSRAGSATRRSSPAVAPGSADVGVMLAYTPLHHLLLGLPGDAPGPTSW